ncbi:transmembrane protein 26-like [Amphiura filiformis]|uniref:transmembrane protein 26-like n=1 Tax=Amphiura filiformis TaxID=82378 RepID=UPI003B218B2F
MCKSPPPRSCSVASVKGVAVRVLYAIHVIVCLWKVMGVVDSISTEENMVTDFFGEMTKKLKYYLVGILGFYLLLTTVECGVIVKRQGGEWKWFSPSILLYLLMVIPCIWVVEWQMYFGRMDHRLNNSISTCNPEDFSQLNEEKTALLGFPENGDFTSKYGMTSRDWSLGLQQVMLFVLIVGRWLSPKGDISRDQLSQLLMVHFGTAADILEYVTEGLSNSVVMCNHRHILIVLVVWSLSMFQFTLSPTATRSKKKGAKKQMSCICFDTEIWSIVVSTCVQDAPFLGTRLYFMVVHQSRNQSSIFFTCKNALLLLIQTYRVIIIILDSKKKPRKRKKKTKFNLQSSPAPRRRGPAKSSSGRFRNPHLRLPRFIRNIIDRYRIRRQRPSSSAAKPRGNKEEGCLSGLKCITLPKRSTTSNSTGGRRWTLAALRPGRPNPPEQRRRHSSKGVLKGVFRTSPPKESDQRCATFI